MTQQHSKQSKAKSPKISRPIPEDSSGITLKPTFWQRLFHSKIFWLNCLSCFLVMIVLGLVYDIQHQTQRLKQLQYTRQSMQDEIAYWKGIVGRYKGYRDAYYQLAVLEYQLGNYDAANGYIAKVKELDPMFKQVDVLGVSIRAK